MSELDRTPDPITNPVDLALSMAHVVAGSDIDRFSPEEKAALGHLDRITSEAGFDGRYFVESGLAIAAPVTFEADQPVNLVHFGDGLTFEAQFVTYSVVKIGNLAVSERVSVQVNALCLTFDAATLLPFFDRLPDDKLLHVPAYAVDDMKAS